MRISYLQLYIMDAKIIFSPLNSMAAIVIQAYWRGYIVRRQSHFSAELHPATIGPRTSQPNSCIENQTILKKEKIKNTVNIQEQKEKAAILIQVSFSLWVKQLILRDMLVFFHWVILYNRHSLNHSNLQIP